MLENALRTEKKSDFDTIRISKECNCSKADGIRYYRTMFVNRLAGGPLAYSNQVHCQHPGAG